MEAFRKFLLILCTALLSAVPGNAFPGKYPIRNFTSDDYKAGIQNIDFAQNRDMTLFVANNLGILSYNGQQWNTHDFRTGKKKRALAFDNTRDRLYVGAQDDFGYYEKNWQYTSLADQLPASAPDFDEVWDVYLLGPKVYFCTFQGIFVYDSPTGSLSVIRREGGLDRSFVVNETLLSQSPTGQLFSVEEESFLSNYPQTFKGEVLAGCLPWEDGLLLIYRSGQVEWTSPHGAQLSLPDLAAALKGTFVNHVLPISNNRLAISTQASGLILYDLENARLEVITTREGLASNACLRSFQDYYGNLWVGMQNGIARIHLNSPLRFLNREINLQGSGYEAFETSDGLYFTTSNGIYFLSNNSLNCRFLSGTEGPAYGIQEIAGRIYAGHHKGLFLLEGIKATLLARTNGLWQVKPLTNRPGFAIGGTYSGLFLFRINAREALEPLGKVHGFNASSRFFEEDRYGNIWVGQYYQGLFRLELSDDLLQARVSPVSGGSPQPIQDQLILSQISNELFLATRQGLYLLDPEDQSIRKSNLFSDQINRDPIYLLEQDKRNHVHIITDGMAAFFKQVSDRNYQFVPSSLYQVRFLLNNDLLHMSSNVGEGVFFSANEGFIHYSPSAESSQMPEYPLIIRRVFSITQDSAIYLRMPFADRQESHRPLEVNPGARVLKIDVESFQFIAPENTSFRYFLKGLDPGFGEWTASPSKEYTNLSPGEYEFLFQSRNHLGQVTDGESFRFLVKPPFYKSQAAKVVYGLSCFLFLFLLFRLQRSRYHRKASHIVRTTQQEWDKDRAKLALAQQEKEQVLQQMKEEKLQTELEHLNKLLGASTMNLVVKNEFIEQIRSELEAVRKKGCKPETKRALDKIVREIEVNLKLQEDWEQFEYHFESVHGDFLSRIRAEFPDLSPNEQRLCALLRLNLNTKDISNLLGVSIRGVEVARYRLRRKLELEKGQNLSKFIMEY